MNQILLKFKGQTVQTFALGKVPLTIGREVGNDIRIDNPAVSGIHARIFREGERIIIEDAGSTNGTFVNGEKTGRAEIGPADMVVIGKHQIGIRTDKENDQLAETDAPLTPVIPSLDKTMVLDSKVRAKALEKEAARAGFIVFEGGVEKERVYLNDRVSTIGKGGDALIRTGGLFAPKVAALVNRTEGGCLLTPSDPGKPPLINGKPSSSPHPLAPGDTVEIGNLRLTFFSETAG